MVHHGAKRAENKQITNIVECPGSFCLPTCNDDFQHHAPCASPDPQPDPTTVNIQTTLGGNARVATLGLCWENLPGPAMQIARWPPDFIKVNSLTELGKLYTDSRWT